MVTTRSQSKELEAYKSAASRKFQKLPAELRRKIWDAALPQYGQLPVTCEREQDEENSSPEVRSFTIHLVGLPRTLLAYDKLPERVRTTRALLMTCHESRKQAEKHFPNVLTCRKGEIRFNAEEDLITLCTHGGFEMTRGIPTKYTFAGNWNLSIHRLAIGLLIGDAFGVISQRVLHRDLHWGVAAVNNFLELLKRFPSLKQLLHIRGDSFVISGYYTMDTSSRTPFRDDLGELYLETTSYLETSRPASKPWMTFDLPLKTERFAGARADYYEGPSASMSFRRVRPLPGPSPRLFRLGDAELRRLEALGMTDINPELRDNGIICTETELRVGGDQGLSQPCTMH